MKKLLISMGLLLCGNLISMSPDLTSEEQAVYKDLIKMANQGLETIPDSYKTEENLSILEKQREFLWDQYVLHGWRQWGRGKFAGMREAIIAVTGTALGFLLYTFGLDYKNQSIKTGGSSLVLASWIPVIVAGSNDWLANIYNAWHWKGEIALIDDLEDDFKKYIEQNM